MNRAMNLTSGVVRKLQLRDDAFDILHVVLVRNQQCVGRVDHDQILHPIAAITRESPCM
jgi:hypothetical protein